MNKYIDAEKLIAEIEKRKKELFEIGGDTFENRWALGSLDSIKAFVISLQQEQPEADLEKEVESCLDGFIKTPTRTYFRGMIKHFYELGLKAKKGGINMNAPDKIYVPQYIMEAKSIRELDKPIVAGSTEYIRKDAFLDWAKEQASITEKLNGKGAMLKAWNTLIDKLNSM